MEIEMITAPNWIYDFSDYQQMYDLSNTDFLKKILDFSAGISSFNAEAHARGMEVVSMDTAFNLSASEMKQHAIQLSQHVAAQLRADPVRLKNSSSDNVRRVVSTWEKTEKLFLKDYETGKLEKRYQSILLSKLPFATHEFQLALCTDFIFYHALPTETMRLVLQELTRVAAEVRIFPLLNANGQMPEELGPLMLYCQQKNYGIEVREVSYHTLKGGNAMLRIWEQECKVV